MLALVRRRRRPNIILQYYIQYYRKAIPLNENEGIYIRNVQTGQVY